MDSQNLVNQPIVTDEQNKNDLSKIMASGESANAGDFIPHAKLTRRQNIILTSIGALVVVAIGLSVWQMSRTLSVPLPVTGKEKEIVVKPKDKLDLSQKSQEELKASDTDADKINDFEELYVYDTSPYLSDSDSDGIDDFDEITNHTDPTCPEGQSCFQSGVAAGSSGSAKALAGGESSGGSASVGENVDFAQVNTDDLRKVLVQSGKVTAEQAAAIDDAMLLEIYGQALQANPDLAKQFQTSQPSATSKLTEVENKATSATEALNALSNISAAEVRKLLLEQGFSETELKLVSDEELMKIYKEALDQASKGVKE